MLFRKRIPRSCVYCAHSAALDENQMLCAKRGTVSQYYGCRKFVYDPCKRIPPKKAPLDTEQFQQEDFTL